MTDYTVRRYHAYSDEELLQALRDFARSEGIEYVSAGAFQTATGISEATAANHFGSWALFCQRAGLRPRYTRGVDRETLFSNLDQVWTELGRQPRAKELKQPLSRISISQYQHFFKSPWFDVCVDFLAWRSGASPEEIRSEVRGGHQTPDCTTQPRGPRSVNLSLRYEVLRRDSFRCRKCGKSPATTPGVQLHIDHIVPWSRGGETKQENLQTLCSECNLGKGAGDDA